TCALPIFIRALAGMGSARAVEAASAALEEPHPDVRAAALATLLRQGSEEQRARAEAVLEQLDASAAAGERALVPRVIADIGLADDRGARWLRALAGALDDGNVEVRREALAAAARLAEPGLW